jgi:hypothetical protein
MGGLGSGTVSSSPAGIDCPGTCSGDFAQDSTVTLAATATNGSAFNGWSGSDCLGNGGTCEISLEDEDVDITATFHQDGDGDGVGDVVELACPNSGDGDQNGTSDFNQNSSASFENVYGEYITLCTESGVQLSQVTFEPNPSPGDAPDGAEFGAGFIGFTLRGLNKGTGTKVTLIFHDAAFKASTYYRYGPTPGNPTDHWYSFNYDGRTGAVISRDGNQTRIVLYFMDGQRGDDDLAENGTITDVGAPNTASTPATSTDSAGCFISALLGH